MAALCLLWLGAPALPESSPCYSTVWHFLGVGVMASSTLAGWLTGSRMKRNALEGTVSALLAFGGLPALLLLFVDHDIFGAVEALTWISLGCLSAWAAERRKGQRSRSGTAVVS